MEISDKTRSELRELSIREANSAKAWAADVNKHQKIYDEARASLKEVEEALLRSQRALEDHIELLADFTLLSGWNGTTREQLSVFLNHCFETKSIIRFGDKPSYDPDLVFILDATLDIINKRREADNGSGTDASPETGTGETL